MADDDKPENSEKPRCKFCESPGGNILFVNSNKSSAICSDCITMMYIQIPPVQWQHLINWDDETRH